MSNPPASTTHTHNPDGTVTLSLTLPAESVTRLTWAADNAADAYRRGSDEDDELLLAELLLGPLAALLWRADHASPVCPDAS